MTKFLISKFVLNKELDKIETRQRYAFLSSFVGIFINIILSAFKIFCGIIFSSIAVLGDGINNLADATSSVVTMFGFKLAEKPADKKHPFGHARMEYISGLIVSFIIMYVGLRFASSSFVLVILGQDPIEFNWLTIVALVVSIFIKFWLYLFNQNISKITKSTAIFATAKDSLNDVFMSLGVLLSTFIYNFFDIDLDAFLGVVLGILIVKSAFDLINDTISQLLGEAPDEEFVSSIYQKLRTYPDVLGFHDLIIHSYGYGRNFISVHVEVDVEAGFMYCHELADEIERDFKNINVHLVVHLDPIITDCEQSNNLKNFIIKTIFDIDSRISMHDFRAVIGEKNTNLIFDVVLPFDVDFEPLELKKFIQNKVYDTHQNCQCIIEIDRNYNNF